MFQVAQANIARCALAGVFLAAGLAVTTSVCAETTVRLMHANKNQRDVDVWRSIADDYEAANPDVKVSIEFLENEAFKAKLPTLLQSDFAPDLFYSWSGGVLKEQAKTGAVQDLTEVLHANDGTWAKKYIPAVMRGVTIDDRALCVPYKMSVIGFFYNKALFRKAGVDAEAIKTWKDFLGAVKTLKAAGITPISGGGGDKWPLHFYWSYLALRIGGEEAFAAAKAGKNGGFKAEPFVEAGRKLRELGELEPFQPGYLGTRWQEALNTFGDGRAAIILSFEDTYNRQVAASADGKGIPRDEIGIFAFPSVEGGKGAESATFGGVNCWAVSRNAPAEALDFAKFFTAKKAEQKMAENNMLIPVAIGAEAGLKDPIIADFAGKLANSKFHQIYLDQDLGPSVGRVVNDITVEVVSGSMTPEEAVEQIQDAFELE